jgi:hypothetical protein
VPVTNRAVLQSTSPVTLLNMCTDRRGVKAAMVTACDNLDPHVRSQHSAVLHCSVELTSAVLSQPTGASVPAVGGGPDEAHGAWIVPKRHEPLGRGPGGGAAAGRCPCSQRGIRLRHNLSALRSGVDATRTRRVRLLAPSATMPPAKLYKVAPSPSISLSKHNSCTPTPA